MDPMVGRNIGGVLLEAKLGAGGMGSVYLGVDTAAKGARRAVKLLSVASPDYLQSRFQREAKIGFNLRHPLLVRVHRYGVSDDFHYLVMDLVEGEDLAHVYQRTAPIGWALMAAIGRDIARGLATIHEKGMVHRDLKPQNVLLDGEGRVRLADFGLASWREGPVESEGSVSLTATGDAFGTPAYMAPEQFEDTKSAGPAADVYALGILLFEGLAGRTPFNASSPQQLSRLHREVPPPSLDALCSDAPAELRRLVGRMLEKSPADRPPADHVATALAALAKHGAGESLPLEVPTGAPAAWSPSRTPDPRPRRGLRRLLLSAVVAALILVGLLLAWESPAVRVQFATPEEQSAWKQVQEVTAAADDPRAIVEALEDYRTYFGGKGLLRLDVKRLWQTPLQLPGRGLYLVPELGADALLVYVPAGSYRIGHPEGDDVTLTRPRTVHLNGYLIDRTEVSNRSYRRFLHDWQAAGSVHRCGKPHADHAAALEVSAHRSPEPDGPVVGVSYYDALEYALYYRRWLPSEEQWEVAASYDRQSGEPRLYPWGQTEPDARENRFHANLSYADWGEFQGDEFVHLATAAGSFELDRSPFGLLDAAGNASEWCRGRDPLPSPQPVRGGCMLSDQLAARAAARRLQAPDEENDTVGFRTVLPFTPR